MTDPAPSEPEPADGSTLLGSLRRRSTLLLERTNRAVEARRSAIPALDTAARFIERDRDAFASVLGSAIALRLFLFFVPVVIVFVGLVNVLGEPTMISSILDASGTGGRVAADIQQASSQSQRGGAVLLGSGIVLMLWAGRSLTTVLAASAAGGWGLAARDAKPTLRMVGTLSGLMFTMTIVAGIMARVRTEQGLVLTGGAMTLSLVAVTFAWWLVTWTLPKGSADPGAQIPGAVFVGLLVTLGQYLMQFYLPGRLARSSATMGTIGVSVAALGYFFLFGRLLASSFVVNAVVFERHGSISTRFFALPGLRNIASRSPAVRQFFQLDEPDVSATSAN